jgi:4-hydroxythreonine-4-phosphate dehydrogenase
MKPTIGITLGDPRGIGYEITESALNHPDISNLADWKIIGEKFNPDLSEKSAGEKSIIALEEAGHALLNQKIDAVVTTPVSKSALKKAYFPYPGQTEFFAHLFKTTDYAMMLCSPLLKVVLVTIHIPLKEVFNQLSIDKIFDKILKTHHCLKNDFGIKNPKIGICGLNPHAGENGILGDEEIEIIQPAINLARKEKIEVSNPLSADTIFHLAIKGDYDAVICHYHDQGLIPLKTLDFERGVNLTINTPYIRTSPDHGPAFGIAGKNQASSSSMIQAMKLAVQIWKNRQK